MIRSDRSVLFNWLPPPPLPLHERPLGKSADTTSIPTTDLPGNGAWRLLSVEATNPRNLLLRCESLAADFGIAANRQLSEVHLS